MRDAGPLVGTTTEWGTFGPNEQYRTAGDVRYLREGNLKVGDRVVVRERQTAKEVFIAAVLGDTLNYAIGRWLGPRAFKVDRWFLKHEHLARTQEFYERHGGKTIVLARFVPIVRTFAPFVAGVGRMHYPQFLYYNVVGGIAWVLICTLAGYFFGNIEAVKKHFELVVVGIVVVSVLPLAWEMWSARRRARRSETVE
jgi:membrane protein DedA with SNARE-associated domain